MAQNDLDPTTRPIPFGRPIIGDPEIDAVVQVLKGHMLVHGASTKAFEAQMAERVGVDHAIAVSSCTAGLHLVLLSSGVGPGDEVIVPAMTHVATGHAVEYCGARPVFVDVEPDTGNIDPEQVARAVTPRTKAIMVVHYLGLPCQMEALQAIADQAGAFIVEDCALAIDATYGTRKAGALAKAGCFSFYPVKHMTSIEGGMVTTNDPELAKAVTQRRAFGYDKPVGKRGKPGVYDVNVLGYNYRMSEVEAAVGLVQLGRLDEHQAIRARNYAQLKGVLSTIPEITVFERIKGPSASSHYCINAILDRDPDRRGGLDRDDLVARLKGKGIGSSLHYPRPVPLMSYYRERYGYQPGDFPVSEWISAQTISLPVAPHLAEGDPERIGHALASAIREAHAEGGQ
ncbi:MAG: DegT/DnrJ/EryC1/StrS family aminotransferase [Bradymonadia bacterium]